MKRRTQANHAEQFEKILLLHRIEGEYTANDIKDMLSYYKQKRARLWARPVYWARRHITLLLTMFWVTILVLELILL